MLGADTWVRRYGRESDRLLAELTEALRRDDRVTAAWLRGSMGTDRADEVADIDVQVAITDAAAPTIVDSIAAFVGCARRPILVQSVFAAPRGGFTRCVLYDGDPGPHQVDWMVWPLSVARVHPPARLLFATEPLPVAASARYDTLVEQGVPDRPGFMAAHATSSCWLFLLIAARYLVRGWDPGVVSMVQLCASTYRRILGLPALPDVPERDDIGGEATTRLLSEVAAALELAIPGPQSGSELVTTEATRAVLDFVRTAAALRG